MFKLVFILLLAISTIQAGSLQQLESYYKLFKDSFNNGELMCSYFAENINYLCVHPDSNQKESWNGRKETCKGWENYRKTFKISEIINLSYKESKEGLYVSGTIITHDSNSKAKVLFTQSLEKTASAPGGYEIKTHRAVFHAN